jgi:hypothetical protein
MESKKPSVIISIIYLFLSLTMGKTMYGLHDLQYDGILINELINIVSSLEIELKIE